MKKNKLILSIETSCDETAAAVLEYSTGKSLPKVKTLSAIVKSQIKLHRNMGGVVPETAARAHVKNILPVVKKTLKDSSILLKNIDYIAITTGPGLVPSLIVGVEFAKALAMATGKPIIPVNHMAGHLYSPLIGLQTGVNIFPMVSLIVSGGHTMIVVMKNIRDYKTIGRTLDDAAGEAFDKVAKMLGLPYPGGPEVSKQAALGKPTINFPRPMIAAKNYNFSFSGLKTAVLYYLQSIPKKKLSQELMQNICASFEVAAVDVLITKTLNAAKEYGAKSISLSGGVSANKKLREDFAKKTKAIGVKFFVPSFNLSTDNAEMIGLNAAYMLHNGYKPKNPYKIFADPNLKL